MKHSYNMKKVFGLGLFVVIIGLVSWKTEDRSKGFIKWKAASKMYKAEGSFENWKVTNLKYDKNAIENTTLDIVVDVSSVHEKSEKLVHHLQQDDYFNVAIFPEATVNISNVVKTDTAYSAQFITTIKEVSDTTTAYFKVLETEPLKVEGYAYINRPKHLIGLPLKKTKGITEIVKVDFMLDLSSSSEE